jgi:lipopolysaccharide export system permease protein
MLFHSSIRAELARSFGATLVVLFTIVVTMLLIRVLGQASSGAIDPKEVMLILGYTVLGRMPTVLTMALFVSIVSVLSRMHQDSEMVIWMGSGRGLLSLLSPVLRFAWPVLLAIAALVLVAWPWANQQASDLRVRFEQRGDLQRVTPGQFQESSNGRRVFFIDKDTLQGVQGRNVFIHAADEGHESTVSAKAARVVQQNQTPFLLLTEGQRLESMPGEQGSFKISEFEEYASRITEKALPLTRELEMKSRSTMALLSTREPQAMAELGWRMGMVWCALNLSLLAVAATTSNPRAGRSGNLAFSIFAFLLYFNLLNLGESRVARGLVTWEVWLVQLHGSVTLLASLWLLKRHLHLSVRNWVRGWSRSASAGMSPPVSSVDRASVL